MHVTATWFHRFLRCTFDVDVCVCRQRDLDFIIEVNFNGELSSKVDLMRYKMR